MGGCRHMTEIAPHTRRNARRLRADMTPHEQRVWKELRDLNRRLGMHFRKQAPIGPYIADFAEFGRKIVIELDGGGHAPEFNGGRDVGRDAWLSTQGFAVLRFWNSDVAGNLEGVMEVVLDALDVAPPPHPSPTGGEGVACDIRGAQITHTSPPPRGVGMGGNAPLQRRAAP